ncbi:allophanate hydrolase [Curtobacterium sp. PhB146]|uniref:allophanate hydrolase n=1 Tax=Curtobacterium sp. PhB146 TaxID=2485187 RepID=UPI001047FBD3|nr:allophanate hydrolase [Curtobacterium sp. PhB146]TCU43767.1 allophanate hydrolase [Curtobacterium sp. PhB146]
MTATTAAAAAPTSGATGTATAAVEHALARLAEVDQPEIWIVLRTADALRELAAGIDARVAGGAELPLAGWTVAVKDNIDVAGLPTTAGSPDVLYTPEASAPTVARLEAAGAVVVGKTNLDQFATGLVGARSPHGVPHAAGDASRVSGGSSAGSGLAVAHGIVDVALGTDTAGSGRVPAAFNHIVGIKPTLGLFPADGVVPASPSYDTVSVFAADLATAVVAADVLAGPGSPRAWPADAPLAARTGTVPRVGVARAADLAPMSSSWRAAYEASVAAVRASGAELVELDVSPLVDVAVLLYGGALLAERAQAFGGRLADLGDRADPTVARIVLPAREFAAVDLVRDQQTLAAVRATTEALWSDVDALLLPTAPGHPTLAELAADPVGVNAWVGTYTNFVNLLDLSALAVPAVGSTREVPVGVSLIGPAFADLALVDLAVRTGLAADAGPVDAFWGADHVDLVVFGAHRTGQPLHHEVTRCGARLLGTVSTAPAYRMARLPTVPPKPGVWRSDADGAAIVGERWAFPRAGFADFVSGLAAPMAIGVVELADGTSVLGFLCEPRALDGAEDVTVHGDWAAVPR